MLKIVVGPVMGGGLNPHQPPREYATANHYTTAPHVPSTIALTAVIVITKLPLPLQLTSRRYSSVDLLGNTLIVKFVFTDTVL